MCLNGNVQLTTSTFCCLPALSSPLHPRIILFILMSIYIYLSIVCQMESSISLSLPFRSPFSLVPGRFLFSVSQSMYLLWSFMMENRPPETMPTDKGFWGIQTIENYRNTGSNNIRWTKIFVKHRLWHFYWKTHKHTYSSVHPPMHTEYSPLAIPRPNPN